MANRYWRGGTGTWDTTSTTNWSATDGGAGGASVPNSADDVFFTPLSGSNYTVTMTGALNVRNITITSTNVTFATGTTPTLGVSGNFSCSSTTVWNSTGTVRFIGSGSSTINGNGITLQCSVNLDANKTWTLTGNFAVSSTSVFTLTTGTLNINDWSLTCGSFSSSNANSRAVNFTSLGKIRLTSTSAGTIFNTGTASNLSVSVYSRVELVAGGAVTKTINAGQFSNDSIFSFYFLQPSSSTISLGSSIVRDLYFDGVQTITNTAVTIWGNFTHYNTNGTTTFAAGNNAWTFRGPTGVGIITVGVNNFVYDFPWNVGTGASYLNRAWQINGYFGLGSTRTMTLVTAQYVDFMNYGGLISGNITLSNASLLSLRNGGASTNNLFTCPANLTITAGTLVLNMPIKVNGSFVFNAGGITLNGYDLKTQIFTSSVTSTRIINFGTNAIYIEGNSTATVWILGPTNFSYTGTPNVIFSGTTAGGVTKTVTAGAHTEASAVNLIFNDSCTFSVSGAMRDLKLQGTQTFGNSSALTIFGDFIHLLDQGATTINSTTASWTFAKSSGTQTISHDPNTAYGLPWTFGTASSTATYQINGNLTLTSTRSLSLVGGTLALGGNITCGLFSSDNGNTRTVNFGTYRFYITATTTSTVWDTTNITGLTYTGTGRLTVEVASAAGSFTRTIDCGAPDEANAINWILRNAAGSVGFTNGNSVYDLTIDGQQTFNTQSMTIYGSYSHSTNNGTTSFNSSASTWTFAGTSPTLNISSGAVTHDFPWTFAAGASTTYFLQSAITLGSNRTTTLQSGTLDLNGFTYTTGLFTNTSGTQTLIVDGGTIIISGSGVSAWSLADPAALTVTTGTGPGTISMTSSTAKTFSGGSKNYSGITLNQGGTGLMSVTGSNTFRDLSASISSSSAATIELTPMTTTTLINFTLSSLSAQVTLSASLPAISFEEISFLATIYREPDQSGYVIVNTNIIAQDIAFTPFTTDGTAPIRWYMGNSTSLRNCTGALAQTYTPGISYKVYVLESNAGSSWTVPSDFNNSDNVIHLFGAGGPGINGVNGGQGGGGGGYTRQVNYNLSNLYQVACSIPGDIGLEGTACSFDTLTANSASYSTGGTGSTANGGNGGVLASSGSAWQGGGGGAAGGINGNGAAGGTPIVLGVNLGRGGPGGGGANGGTAGAGVTGGTGGVGGNSNLGAGTGGAGGNATQDGVSGNRGGGGGGAGTAGPGARGHSAGKGGFGIEILGSLGAGGGGGGGGTRSDGGGTDGTIGGRYGGGGGGGGFGSSQTSSGGYSAGARGAVIIQYVPLSMNKFFQMFVPN